MCDWVLNTPLNVFRRGVFRCFGNKLKSWNKRETQNLPSIQLKLQITEKVSHFNIMLYHLIIFVFSLMIIRETFMTFRL